MKKNLLLAFPLILLSACNGSDSNSDKVAKSTFDAVTAELEQANNAKDELTKKNQELAGQLSNANTTIVTGEDERTALKTALDFTLVKLEQSIDAGQEKDKIAALKDNAYADKERDHKNTSDALAKAKDDLTKAQKDYEEAVKTGKIGADGKSAYVKELEAATDKVRIAEAAEEAAKKDLDDAKRERDAAVKDRDDAKRDLAAAIAERNRLNDALTKLVEKACK
ncbi:hypothetical protein [Phyllobacterium sp. P5_D12]